MAGTLIVCMFCFCFIDRSMDNNHHRLHLLVTRGKKQNELRKNKLLQTMLKIKPLSLTHSLLEILPKNAFWS